ncbi:MAG TPA: response regulator [Methylomirabilota bacterium]|jgi:DNA-binding response OmpR family regulator|nr:response regulator [Methylomirabilota bacterium]
MRVLIADDTAMFRRLVRITLEKAGYEVSEVADGAEALHQLESNGGFPLAILDWMMPKMKGVEVCRVLRERPTPAPPYLILLTSKDRPEDVVAGLEAGADDYITKPFRAAELRARVQVGARILSLRQALADRVIALEQALGQVRQLQGLLPICAWCKNVRNDQNYWQSVERYVAEHSEAQFTHTICPPCREKHITPQIDRLRGASP